MLSIDKGLEEDCMREVGESLHTTIDHDPQFSR